MNLFNQNVQHNEQKGASMTQEERISNLEKRMSALERNLQDRQKIGNEIISSWQKVMYEFCITYGIDISHITEKGLNL